MNELVVNVDQGTTTISKHIFGHFAEHLGHCIYGGFWVGEDSDIPNVRGIRTDIVEALRATNIPVLRWPGGCFADEYHWRDGIGPRHQRPCMINTHWGGVTEDNAFGTHEFMDLCDQLGCEPYICGNVGSGTVYEMQQWVEYLTLDGVSPMADLRKANGRAEPWPLTYWGVGNENWGCGGSMRPEYYADLYRRYGTYVRNYGENVIYKVACGASSADYRWTEVLMREAVDRMHGLSLHYYTRLGAAPNRGSATEFDEREWFQIMNRAMFTEELVDRHCAIMDVYDPHKTVGLLVDEWGTWYEVEPGTNPGFLYQQNSLRDALVAGISLNAFCRRADRVHMANIAQTVNVLQAMILTDGPRMLLTPTYHVFDMFKVHQDAVLLPFQLTSDLYRMDGVDVPNTVRRPPNMPRDEWSKMPSLVPAGAVSQVSACASRDAKGTVHITLCNLDPNNAANLTISLGEMQSGHVTGTVLTDAAMTAHNTFDAPDALTPAAFHGATITPDGIAVTLPAKSVVAIEIT